MSENDYFIDKEEVIEETIDLTIYDREGVLRNLKEDGLKLKNYSDQIKNDFECIMTAINSNYKAYEYIADKYKTNPKVISIYWKKYIESKEETSKDKKFEDFYPEFLNTNKSLDDVIFEITRRKE